jgi:hypothetical protein
VRTPFLISGISLSLLMFSFDGAAQAQPTGSNLTTVCQFSSGPKAGTTFDFKPYGVQPIPVGYPCTDGQGSNGTAIP